MAIFKTHNLQKRVGQINENLHKLKTIANKNVVFEKNCTAFAQLK